MIVADVREYVRPRKLGAFGAGEDWVKIFTAPLDALATGWATANSTNASIAASQAASNAALAQAQAEKTETVIKYAAIGAVGIIGMVVAGKFYLSRRKPAAAIAGYRRRKRRSRR